MRFGSPSPDSDHFERDNPVEGFLSRPENGALAAFADFVQQLVIAELHGSAFRMFAFTVPRHRRQGDFEQTNPAKSVRRVRQDLVTALCASSGCARFGKISHFHGTVPKGGSGHVLENVDEMPQLVFHLPRIGHGVRYLLQQK
jgi:hypothetical protein